MRNLILALALVAFGVSSCDKNDEMVADSSFGMQAATADYSGVPATVQTVSGMIASNTTWSNDRVWEIDGVVTVKGNATLTIDPGTFIKAKRRTDGKASGVLVISKKGRINAVGTPTNPIVFTSYNLLDGNAATKASPGDFGGVILLGEAPVNKSNEVIEGLTNFPAVEYRYGGTNNGHSSGIMKYVRIEYAGYILEDANEVNGLTCGGVGYGTTLSHIQVSYGADDSFEFFGGTVNADHLVSFAPDDDNFDFDFGYTGTIEYALALADKNSTHSQSKGKPDSNGIELDNDGAGNSDTPITHPTVKYMTIVGMNNSTDGALYENGVHIRRNGEITLEHSIVTGYPVGVKFDGVSASNSSLYDLGVHGFANDVLPVGTNLGTYSESSIGAIDQFDMVQPFFNVSGLDLTGPFFRGAFVDGDWLANWTKFDNF